jgi:hypothetical protein
VRGVAAQCSDELLRLRYHKSSTKAFITVASRLDFRPLEDALCDTAEALRQGEERITNGVGARSRGEDASRRDSGAPASG